MVVIAGSDTEIAGASGSLREITGRDGAVIVVDEPLVGQSAIAVIGAGYGRALCIESAPTAQLVDTDHLPTVATLARAILGRSP